MAKPLQCFLTSIRIWIFFIGTPAVEAEGDVCGNWLCGQLPLIFKFKERQCEGHGIEYAHAVIFAHPGLSESRQSRGKLREALCNGVRDLVFVYRANFRER